MGYKENSTYSPDLQGLFKYCTHSDGMPIWGVDNDKEQWEKNTIIYASISGVVGLVASITIACVLYQRKIKNKSIDKGNSSEIVINFRRENNDDLAENNIEQDISESKANHKNNLNRANDDIADSSNQILPPAYEEVVRSYSNQENNFNREAIASDRKVIIPVRIFSPDDKDINI